MCSLIGWEACMFLKASTNMGSAAYQPLYNHKNVAGNDTRELLPGDAVK